ncbi:MAG: Twin-arginine translocation pathway signal sequence protein [Betaproteobacteria bacterium]|nr:Twin-arginine translocation pathway signal sequence protein [Betaproteobacteria bacterium]
MQRRDFLSAVGAATVAAWVPAFAHAGTAGRYENLLIIVELKGGNDGLNTVIPYADADYQGLRPRLAIARDQVLQLDARTGLHPSLGALMPLWQNRELAVVQGVGYPGANLSHFRSIEIWDTASKSSEYLSDGWLTRAFAQAPVPRAYAADGIVVGSNEMGPLAGGGTRALALTNTEQFLRQAKLAGSEGVSRNAALNHILKVEQDVVQAAGNLSATYAFRTEFPANPLGNAFKTAAQVVASKAGVAVVKITQNGYDTHSGQQGTQQRLLKELAEGINAMRSAMQEIDRWNSALMMTYCEFGRRPKENQSGGTDHGTANAHFVLGGRVKGGLYGAPPALNRLDGNGNLPFAVDFRDLYATALERWWGLNAVVALNGRFIPVDVLKA